MNHVDLEELLAMQEILWKQKTHDNQISMGDCNTRFFYNKVEKNKWRNTIHSLLIDNKIIEKDEDLMSVFLHTWGNVMTYIDNNHNIVVLRSLKFVPI